MGWRPDADGRDGASVLDPDLIDRDPDRGRPPAWTAGVSPASSPDRVDALVWALTELFLNPMPGAAIFEDYRQRASETKQD